ncbi:methyl-accepting chemotaxis protein [Geobacter benzoatilyticus]|uniref:Methyl-accepting chemotaxis protein n=1 Tax=Geobacter benzoatilyticus TaxID=2815309 RepID=A0ABX7Q5T9_9BACT|nr:methyl-accepting chemotaxis protein [Geobacter benzoatilyticus]QSV46365.1 methyl-accepting chemotaxis protein [Geobacter benzoatilyticus]
MTIKRYRNWGILPKVMTISALTVVLFAGMVLLFFLPYIEGKMMDGKKESTRNVVEVAFATLNRYGEKAKLGEIPLEEAQRLAMADIKELRYKGKEYFWINDLSPRMIMHPVKPELDGTDLSGNKDPKGKHLFVEFVKVCREKGAGFVDYMWPMPGQSEPVPKISYVKLYEPWGWIIGSGIYVDDVRSDMAKLHWGVIGGTLIFSVLTLMLALSVGLGIVRPLRNVVASLHDIADGEGDLTKRIAVTREDESGDLARSFNTFVEKLQGIIGQVAQNATMVAASASQVESASRQMANGADHVAGQAGTVATASEEMAATSVEIAGNCVSLAEGANQASATARTGAAVVQETVSVMSRIAERVKDAARTVDSLGTRSDQIGEIIRTIEDIADQTNLLALNAAIEAARAGEYGRGFAVVADEVRALAERTTRATKEISQMIKAIQQETKGAVASMEEGVNEVELGTGEAARSGDALRDILDQINNVTMQINQIATAAEQQTATTTEISRNIQQITDVAHDTASGAQQSAGAAGQLAELAEELQKLVGRFRLAS